MGDSFEFPFVPGRYPCEGLVTNTLCLGRPKDYTLGEGTCIKTDVAHTCDKPDQLGATCLGPVFGPSYTCRQCSCNAFNALVKRHGARAPAVTGRFEDASRHYAGFRTFCLLADRVYYDAWLAKWPLTKQQAILDSVRTDEVRPNGVKAFVKREPGHAVPSKARLIQGYCNLATQECVAREQSVFQKALGMMFNIDGYELSPGVLVTMASGMSNLDISEWMRVHRSKYSRPFFYERDGKNWDSTMQREHHVYKLGWMRAYNGRLADFVDKGFVAECFVKCKSGMFRYTLNGTVKSGHNDTTSGNSLINAAISSHALSSCRYRASVIVLGDDMLAIVEGKPDLEGILRAERAYGIVPEGSIFYDIGDVHFISSCFLESVAGDVAFVPILGRQLARLWWTTNPPAKRKLRNYRFSVASGLASAVGGLPIYGAFLDPMLSRGGALIDVDKFKYSAHTSRIPPGDYLPAICRRYGLSPSEVSDFEDFLRTLGPAECVVHEVATRIMARDFADVTGRSPIAPPFADADVRLLAKQNE